MGAVKRKQAPSASGAQQVDAPPAGRCYSSSSKPVGRKRPRPAYQSSGALRSDQQQVFARPAGQASADEPVWIYGLINNIEQMLSTMNAAQGATIGSTCRGSMPASPLSSAVPSPPGSSGSSYCPAASPSASSSCLAPTSPPMSAVPKSPISRQIKFHEYKGPPTAKRQPTSNSSYQQQQQLGPAMASGKAPAAHLATDERKTASAPRLQHSIQPQHAAIKSLSNCARVGLAGSADSSAPPLGPRRSSASTPIEQIRPDAVRLPRQTGDKLGAEQGQMSLCQAPGDAPSAASLASSPYRPTHQSSSPTEMDRVLAPSCPLPTRKPADDSSAADESDLAHVCGDLFTGLDLPNMEYALASPATSRQHVGLNLLEASEQHVDEELLFSEFIDLQDLPMNVTESDWLKKFLPPSCSLSSHSS